MPGDPDPGTGKEARDAARFAETMAEKKSHMDQKQLEEVAAIADELHARQAAPDTPEALAPSPCSSGPTLPGRTISNIPR